MLKNTDINSPNLEQGPNWQSFEQFRTAGATVLEPVKSGMVATLQTKTGQYRILEESDFQKLYGLARDVDRLRGGLKLVLSAVRVVKKHPDAESIDTLLKSVQLLGSLPELPVQDDFETLTPEGFEVDEDDEVILDPSQVPSPFDNASLDTEESV